MHSSRMSIGEGSLSRGGVSVQVDLCPVGLCPGDFCPEALCRGPEAETHLEGTLQQRQRPSKEHGTRQPDMK